ncbi:MAG TPA: alpha/beta hydrolase [Anaerolineales bacterium]|nr:alpha/beta hydrolase [Anaerolineales bacterium]
MPDELQRLDLSGIEIVYRTVGDAQAPTVVLLHGWASSRRMWESAQQRLSAHFRTIALDLPGHGESSKPDWTWYSIPRYTDLVDDLMEALELRRPAIVGHSMGGTIGLELASRQPNALECLIAVNPVVTGRVYSRGIPLGDEWVEPAVRVSRRVWPAASRLLTRPPEALRRRAPNHVLRNREDLGMTTADSALGSMRAVLTWDLTSQLEEIRTRTLVIVGDQDRVVAPGEGELAARRVPGGRLMRLRAAHHPHDEVPDEFYPAIEAFLAGAAY